MSLAGPFFKCAEALRFQMLTEAAATGTGETPTEPMDYVLRALEIKD